MVNFINIYHLVRLSDVLDNNLSTGDENKVMILSVEAVYGEMIN